MEINIYKKVSIDLLFLANRKEADDEYQNRTTWHSKSSTPLLYQDATFVGASGTKIVGCALKQRESINYAVITKKMTHFVYFFCITFFATLRPAQRLFS